MYVAKRITCGGERRGREKKKATEPRRSNALIGTVRVISISSPLQFKGYRRPPDAFIPAKKFTPLQHTVQLSTYGHYTCNRQHLHLLASCNYMAERQFAVKRQRAAAFYG